MAMHKRITKIDLEAIREMEIIDNFFWYNDIHIPYASINIQYTQI